MDCGAIRQRLSPYLEGIISSAEKKLIEEHLLSCQTCSVALRDLKRAGELVRDLKEVEPPPWMTQKVLARIRREQEGKKGVFEKFFFPLRIKIPIQATATVLIVVLAIYVFKAGEPELKKVQSPMVADEIVSKGEGLKQPSVPAAEIPAPESKTAPKRLPEPSERRDVSRSVEEKDKKEITLPGREGGGEVAGVGKIKEYETARDFQAKERKAPAAGAPLRAAVAKRAEAVSIIVQVRDVKMAAGEIEALLHQFGATRIEKESLQDTEVITAELQSEKIGELMEKLRFKGEIKEKESPSPIPTGKTSIKIEVFSVR